MLSPRSISRETSRDGGTSPGQTFSRGLISGVTSYSMAALHRGPTWVILGGAEPAGYNLPEAPRETTVKTPRTSRLPPFFTHGIGSLPRPQALRDLLSRRQETPPDRFRRTLD